MASNCKPKRRKRDGGTRLKGGLLPSNYTTEHLAQIAKAAGVREETVKRHQEKLKAIALKYWIDTGGPVLLARSVAIRKLKDTARAARKLLQHMGVNHRDISKVAEGHRYPQPGRVRRRRVGGHGPTVGCDQRPGVVRKADARSPAET
jgi:hypothetical protein